MTGHCYALLLVFAFLIATIDGAVINVQRDQYAPEAVQWIIDNSQVVGRLDLVFIVDNTGSMKGQIDATKGYLLDIVAALKASPLARAGMLRIGAVAYSDYPDQGSSYVTRAQDFTDDMNVAKTFVDSMSAAGGGDWPEAVGAALKATADLSWGQGHARLAVLIADAPPHGVKDASRSPRWEDGLETLKEMGVSINSLLWSEDFATVKVFRRFASETGGIFQILSGSSGNNAIAPITVCSGEAQLDLLYLASRGIAMVAAEIDSFKALPTDQLRMQSLWSSMQSKGLKRLDISKTGSSSAPAYGLKYRELDFDDIITVTRLMVDQPLLGPCTTSNLFCSAPLLPQAPRGLLPVIEMDSVQSFAATSFRTPASPFKLDSLDLVTSISGSIADVSMTQIFSNTASKDNQVEYVLPLSPRSAVYGFQAVIGDKTLVGVIKERAQAQKEFQEAIKAGKTALLLSAAEDVSENTFRVALGNVAVGVSVAITVKYVVELEVASASNSMRLVVPTAVVPPFRVAPTAFTSASAVESTRPAGGYAMSLTISAVDASTLTSPSHAALVKLSPNPPAGQLQATLAPGQLLQDILIDVGFQELPGAVLEEWPALPGQNEGSRPEGVPSFALLARLAPNLPGSFLTDVSASKVHLIIDASASMAQTKAVGDSRTAASAFVRALSSAIATSGAAGSLPLHIEFIGKTLASREFAITSQYNDNAASFALSGVAGADGGTDVVGAIGKALAAGATEIVFVTDGLISELGLLLDAVQLSSVRFHGVGVGARPYRASLRQLADLTGGSTHFLYPGEDAAAVAALLAGTCLRGVPTPVTPVFRSYVGTALTVQRFVPQSVQNCVAGNIFTAIALFDASSSAQDYLDGEIALSTYSFSVAESNATTVNGRAIHRVAAMRAIRALEADERSLAARLAANTGSTSVAGVLRAQLDKSINSVQLEIVDIGLKYSLVSTHTSFLIIDETVATTPMPGVDGGGASGGTDRASLPISEISTMTKSGSSSGSSSASSDSYRTTVASARASCGLQSAFVWLCLLLLSLQLS